MQGIDYVMTPKATAAANSSDARAAKEAMRVALAARLSPSGLHTAQLVHMSLDLHQMTSGIMDCISTRYIGTATAAGHDRECGICRSSKHAAAWQPPAAGDAAGRQRTGRQGRQPHIAAGHRWVSRRDACGHTKPRPAPE